MSDVYTIKDMMRLGEYDSMYGQKWWGKVEEAQMEVSFNAMDKDLDFQPNDAITFEERLIKNTKGTVEKPSREYLFLKKVKKLNSGSRSEVPTPSSETKADTTPAAGPPTQTLQTINAKLDLILKYVTPAIEPDGLNIDEVPGFDEEDTRA